MNAVQMVVMNGIDSGGEFTFRNSKKGASVTDYIILSDNIVIPDSNGNTTDRSVEMSVFIQKSRQIACMSKTLPKYSRTTNLNCRIISW